MLNGEESEGENDGDRERYGIWQGPLGTHAIGKHGHIRTVRADWREQERKIERQKERIKEERKKLISMPDLK